MWPHRSKAKPKATDARPVVEEAVEVHVYAEDSMSEDESDGEEETVEVRVYAEDDMSADEANGEDFMEESSESGAEESKEEAAEKEMDAGADETKGEEMDAEPEANGADTEKTKVEAADAKVEAEEHAAAAAVGGSGEEAEDWAYSDAEGEGTDAVEESPPPSHPARSRRCKRAATPNAETDDEEEEIHLPLRRRRKARERGDSPPPVPDNLRCRRSDGKKWRCAARALPNVCFCEYHYAKATKGKKPPADGELLAVALQRLKKNKRKGRRRLNLTPESPKATKDLPNGFMTISPGSSGAVGSPVTTEVVPRAMSKAKGAQMSCHRCGLKKVARVVKCKNCEKNCFCNRCINKWYYGISRKDMKMKCPVCRGSCDCKRCTLGQTEGAVHKVVMTKVRVDSVQANDYSIKRCISALTATTLAPDEKIKASEVFQILANRETFLSFNETDPEIALLWLRGKVDKL